MTTAARLLRWARRQAGYTQRELAEMVGVPQATVARIEAGRSDPRLGLLGRLVQACGYEVELAPRGGQGVDRSHLRARLHLSPAERLAQITSMVRSASEWEGIARRAGAAPRRTPDREG